MKKFFSKLKDKMMMSPEEEDLKDEEGYVELEGQSEESGSKVVVRPFTINEFEDIKPILDAIRKGETICLINIKPLKDKDLLELKRAVNKLKKTADAVEGEIAGFGDDWLVATPSFATIYRTGATKEVSEDKDADL